MIGELDALTSDVTALSQEIIGTVQLGVIGTAALWLVPEILDLVPTVHPHLHLIFREATTHGLDGQLASGEIDLGVLALPASGSEVHTVPLFEEDLGLFLPRSHPLAARSVLTVADLASLSLLLPVAGSNYRIGLDAAAAAAGVTLHPRAELDSLRLMRSLMFERCGFAILPASTMPLGQRKNLDDRAGRGSRSPRHRRRATSAGAPGRSRAGGARRSSRRSSPTHDGPPWGCARSSRNAVRTRAADRPRHTGTPVSRASLNGAQHVSAGGTGGCPSRAASAS